MNTPAIAIPKIRLCLLILASLIMTLTLSRRCEAVGSWSYVNTSEPGSGAQTMLLMPDGTVMVEDSDGISWYKLTPDIHGNYQNGTWSSPPAMHFSRTWCSTQVLPDGRLFTCGGEYGTGTTNAEVYGPISNVWTIIPVPAGLITVNNTIDPTYGNNTAGFLDSGSKLLANGKVLIFPVFPATPGRTVLFDPASNTLSLGPALFRGSDEDEASCVKLPDASLLSVDFGTAFSSRYIPASNTFINDANLPVALYDPYGYELGPGFLLPNGKAIFFGSVSNTAIYTPSGTTAPGSWVAGPNYPNGQGMPDAPGAMMVDGRILLATSPVPTPSDHFPGTTSFYEYDHNVGTTGAFTQVSAPGGGFTLGFAPYGDKMLQLPNGQVLTCFGGTTLTLYTPGGAPLLAGKPTINTITTNLDGTLHLTGTLFNGISEGANYGDDEQMDSNYPLVRFTDPAGNVRYGRTYNWSSTGVQTGAAIVSTECAIPAGASLSNNIVQVVANGNASDGVSLVVLNTADSGAGSLRQVVNFLPAGGKVTFTPSLSGQTIKLTSGQITISQNLTIDGTSLANGVRLDGNHATRIMGVGAVNVALKSLVFTNGYTTNTTWGAAIFNGGGNLTLSNCTFVNNTGDSSIAGGAIANQGPMIATACTFSGNSAGFSGAIDNRSTCNLQNCTFYGNSAFAGNGGAIDNPYGAILSVLHCTFYGNSASSSGGGIDNYQATVYVTNSILASNGSDIFNWPSSTVWAGGVNIIPGLANAGIFIPYGPILASDPLLGPLANNGGPTKTMVPQVGSPAIDAGVTSADGGLAFDQRGVARVIGDAVDIGAVEATIVPYVFNAANAGYGSLRYAINYSTNNSTVTFAPALSGQTIGLTSGEMDVLQNLTIDASTLSNNVTLNGNHASRIMGIGGGATVTLKSLTITNGYAASDVGGGILNGGNLTMIQCSIAGNKADSNGGGIENNGPLTVIRSSLFGNLGFGGGAIDNNAALVVNESTLANNSGSGAGDGIWAGGTLTMTNCTVVGNAGAGIQQYLSAPIFLVNTVVAQNAGNNVNGSYGGLNNFTSGNPSLGALGNYGGSTATMPPLPGSPVVDAGNDSVLASFATDQRGLARLVGAHVDIGAVESTIIASTNRALLAGNTVLSNRAFRFSFTNLTGASFTVLASTNIALPVGSWSSLGTAVESPAGSGHFQFTDPQATNSPRRFYRVRSP